MKPYAKEFEVRYYEVDQYQQATPVTILHYLEDTAIAHSEAVGLGITELKKQGVAWLLNRWSVQITRYPGWNEKVMVETWPSHFERFYATRNFIISDESRKIIGKATSLWVFINLERKRPIRIPEPFMLPYGLNPRTVLEEPYGELWNVESPDYVKEFYVRRSDIDTNQHVNNTRYLDWFLETVPEAVFEDYRLEAFEIQYKKEIGLGAMISARSQVLQEKDQLLLLHTISAKEQCFELALAKTQWRRR